jgi:protocatechuate 3,4-dioxygenase beta subunit
MTHDEHHITRRASLGRFAGIVATALGAGALEAADDADAGPAAVASGAVRCVLTPELTEGPYYIAGEKVRRDITEGRPGVALTLKTTVVNASTCKAIKGAAVDIWHCDAGGLYSGYTSGAGGGGPGGHQEPTDKLTFMRGIQRTDATGLATFKTIYPGWYQGRAVHIHVKVHVRGSVVHTGQLFFSDALTDKVYERSPYAGRGTRDKRNGDDSIFVNGGSKGLVKAARSGSGYVATITMGVVTS